MKKKTQSCSDGSLSSIAEWVLDWFWSHRTGRFPVAAAAVDAADLSLWAGQRDTLKIWPEKGRI